MSSLSALKVYILSMEQSLKTIHLTVSRVHAFLHSHSAVICVSISHAGLNFVCLCSMRHQKFVAVGVVLFMEADTPQTLSGSSETTTI